MQFSNVLHVPTITKNLLSVSSLTSDNPVFVEFHARHCYVKDLATRKVLLHRKASDGIYQIKLPNPITYVAAFDDSPNNRSRSTKDLWH